MPLVLYVFLVVMLLGTGVRAVAGHGLALTLYRNYHGQLARPIGMLFIAIALSLAGWLALNPSFAAHLWQGPAR